MIPNRTDPPDTADREFLRRVTWPEEDRALFTTVPWSGGYRWFRSPNIVPLEQHRKKGLTDGKD
jgi:hypothetical protein